MIFKKITPCLHKYDIDSWSSSSYYPSTKSKSRDEIIEEYKQENNRKKYKKEFIALKKEYSKIEAQIDKLDNLRSKIYRKLSNKFGYEVDE